ncbi:MAG: signal peptidase II [Phyllobacterium sp.]
MTRSRAILWFALIVVFAVVSDQLIKFWVETNLNFQEKVEILPFLAVFRTYNEGIAFSMLSGFHDLGLVLLTLVVIGFVSYLWWTTTAPTRWLSRLGFALIIGGAVGNVIDRGWHGHVIDYILFFTPNWSFAVFNLADSFITVGAGAVILDELLHWWRERSRPEDNRPAD